MNLSEVIVTNILRPNHLTSLHCLSGAARGGEEKLGKANIGIFSIAKSSHSTSVCSPGLSDHAMYEVDLERSSEATATELRVVHC